MSMDNTLTTDALKAFFENTGFHCDPVKHLPLLKNDIVACHAILHPGEGLVGYYSIHDSNAVPAHQLSLEKSKDGFAMSSTRKSIQFSDPMQLIIYPENRGMTMTNMQHGPNAGTEFSYNHITKRPKPQTIHVTAIKNAYDHFQIAINNIHAPVIIKSYLKSEKTLEKNVKAKNYASIIYTDWGVQPSDDDLPDDFER